MRSSLIELNKYKRVGSSGNRIDVPEVVPLLLDDNSIALFIHLDQASCE
jgi:hypothetical protein